MNMYVFLRLRLHILNINTAAVLPRPGISMQGYEQYEQYEHTVHIVPTGHNEAKCIGVHQLLPCRHNIVSPLVLVEDHRRKPLSMHRSEGVPVTVVVEVPISVHQW